jgi:hypothetical protein
VPVRPLSSRTRAVALALAAWTLLTWTTRVPLAWGDDALDTGEKVLATLPVLAFVVLAAAGGLALLRRSERAGTAAVALAGWSLAYWLVRLPLILAHDHPAGFLVVHAVLAGVAGTLSAMVLAGLVLVGRPRGATQ